MLYRAMRPPRGRSSRPAELFLCMVLAVLAGRVVAEESLNQPPGSESKFERCRLIKDGSARLRCYEEATSGHVDKQPPVFGGWRLVHTPNPAGGPDAISIMQTADISRSDIDLAGLTIRCAEGTAEVLVVLVRPFPPRAHPKVTIEAGSTPVEFNTSVASPGLMLLLPADANALATGPWQTVAELKVEIADEHAPIHGVIPLTGLGAALRLLQQNCRP